MKHEKSSKNAGQIRSKLRWAKSPIANRQSLGGQLSQAIPQIHVERILHQRTPIARFESQCNGRRVYEDQFCVFRGRYDRNRTLVIRIAALILASASAITLARFRPSKGAKFGAKFGTKICKKKSGNFRSATFSDPTRCGSGPKGRLEGGDRRGVARGKGPPLAMGGLGGPSKGQLGPDPHLGHVRNTQPCFCSFSDFPCLFVRFYSLFQGFAGSAKRKTLVFFGVCLAFWKSKGWRVRVTTKFGPSPPPT